MENKTQLSLALKYLQRGWSVIICGADKRPLINWKEYQTRMATPIELVKWFNDFPDAQVGIVTGEISNLTVIDLEKDADFDLIKDETYRVKTGGDGIHVYCQYDPDFQNAVRVLPEIDLRSAGGFVVSAGSRTEKGAYTELNDLDVAPMSKETKEKLTEAKKPQYGTPQGGLLPNGEMPAMKTLEYEGAGEGTRNDSMTRYIGMVLAKVHPSLWETMGWEAVKSANLKNNPPLPDAELLASFTSIRSRETLANPGGRDFGPKEKEWGPSTAKVEKPKSADNIEEEEQYEPAVILHASEAADRQEIDTDTAFPIDMKSFDDALLGGFSPGELIVVAGKTGTGKTTLMQDWTVKLSTGGATNHEPLPSLWFSYEVLVRPLWDKFKSMGAEDSTPIYLPSYNESVNVEWVTDMIDSGIDQKGLKLVAIDHLGFLTAPKGNYANAADAITHTVRHLKRLAVKNGLIILLPVHMRKTHSKAMDTDDIKDSAGIAQEADTVFFVDREKEKDGIYKQGSKIGLIKNRKTGISIIENVPFYDGKFFYEAPDDVRGAKF